MKKLAIETDAIPPDEVVEFDTFDEALAYTLATAEPGCIVTIHQETCAMVDDNGGECNCEPIEMTAGASA